MSKESRMKGHARGFIVNIAIADLCVAGIADPMCVVGALIGREYLDNIRWFCITIASLCLTACICVFLNLVNITVNRWVFICHNHLYSALYNRYTTFFICAVCWITGFAAEAPNFFGWGGHFFDEKTHQCIWDRTASRSYTLFLALGLITMPFFVLSACHVAIFRKIYSVKKEINVFNRDKQSILNSLSTAKTLLAMFLVFLVCWMPYVLILVLDHLDTFPMETHLFITLLAHSHSSTACLIYLAFNKKFRDHLRRLCGLENRVEPTLTNPHMISIKQSAQRSSSLVKSTSGSKRTGLEINPPGGSCDKSIEERTGSASDC